MLELNDELINKKGMNQGQVNTAPDKGREVVREEEKQTVGLVLEVDLDLRPTFEQLHWGCARQNTQNTHTASAHASAYET